MGFHRGVGGNPRQYRPKARNGKVRHELYYIGKTRRVLHDRIDEHFFDAADTLVAKKNRAIIQSGGGLDHRIGHPEWTA
jgi:hypothetical protein